MIACPAVIGHFRSSSPLRYYGEVYGQPGGDWGTGSIYRYRCGACCVSKEPDPATDHRRSRCGSYRQWLVRGRSLRVGTARRIEDSKEFIRADIQVWGCRRNGDRTAAGIATSNLPECGGGSDCDGCSTVVNVDGRRTVWIAAGDRISDRSDGRDESAAVADRRRTQRKGDRCPQHSKGGTAARNGGGLEVAIAGIEGRKQIRSAAEVTNGIGGHSSARQIVWAGSPGACLTSFQR